MPDNNANILNTLTIENFYWLCYQFVMYYSKQQTICQRPQTFAVLQDITDIQLENLGKTVLDTGKIYFFSRKWAKNNFSPSALSWDYPGMFIIDNPGTLVNPLKKQSDKCYNMEILFIDRYREDCLDKKRKCGSCAKRTPNEIYKQTEAFMEAFFDYLSNVVYLKDSAQGTGFINKEVAEALGIGGTVDVLKTKCFIKYFCKNNETLTFTKWGGKKSKTYGTFFNLKFCLRDCKKEKFEPQIRDYKIGLDINCC